MLQEKDIRKNWLKVNPISDPVLKDLPVHQPEKFENYTELKDSNDKVIGFQVKDEQYFFDQEGGWRDELGCHYDKDGQPAGWFVLDQINQNREHFYDQDGLYVPTDDENELSDLENQGDEDQEEEHQDDLQEYDNEAQ